MAAVAKGGIGWATMPSNDLCEYFVERHRRTLPERVVRRYRTVRHLHLSVFRAENPFRYEAIAAGKSPNDFTGVVHVPAHGQPVSLTRITGGMQTLLRRGLEVASRWRVFPVTRKEIPLRVQCVCRRTIHRPIVRKYLRHASKLSDPDTAY